MQNNNFKGIDSSSLKKLSLELSEYCEEFKKIKSSLNIIESKLRTNFAGEAGYNYANSFKNFINNFDYVSSSMKYYSDYCLDVIRKYEKNDSLNVGNGGF